MKALASNVLLKFVCILCVLGGCEYGFALDLEAFSITNYNLNLQIDPAQHRLGARGKITLRNDTGTPQKIAVLQISSSLDWRAIRAGENALQFVTQPLTSDIDHTGGLSEAIVTLPAPVAPHATTDLDIAYEGVILLDATRLTRIGTPEDVAKSSDWDQIDEKFIAVRGAGYVAWYPIATKVANLSEPDSLFEALARWKTREAESEMSVMFESTQNSPILFSGTKNGFVVMTNEPVKKIGAFSMIRPYADVPTFVSADYKEIEANGIYKISFLPGKDALAASLAETLGTFESLPKGREQIGLQIAELALPDAAPFVTQNLLLMPFRQLTQQDKLTLVYALSRGTLPSPHAWVTEGFAHFVQALYIERQQGRGAAIAYLQAHTGLLVEGEKQSASATPDSKSNENVAASHSLINSSDDLYVQAKSMAVWWMLYDMVGDFGINFTLSQYSSLSDKDPSYMPRLIASHTQRDLGWFFDDWVYRDHGLPDFKVESAFSRKALNSTFIVSVTVQNLGNAGAEVPVIVKLANGEVSRKLEVRAKGRATIRIETPSEAQEVVVNDGSVPESDMTNNSFKVVTEKE